MIHPLQYRIAFVHLGELAEVAAYFILTQTLTGQPPTIFSWHVVLPDVNGVWDHLLTPETRLTAGWPTSLMSTITTMRRSSRWTP